MEANESDALPSSPSSFCNSSDTSSSMATSLLDEGGQDLSAFPRKDSDTQVLISFSNGR